MGEYESIDIEIEENPVEQEKSDIDYIREKYINQKSSKADEIIAVQAVICIILAIGFFVMNMFYPDICQELYTMFQSYVKDTENPVPYISDYL